MFQVILCDDNPQVLTFYERLLQDAANANNIEIKLTCFESGEQLLFNLSDQPNCADIIYLDILMGQTNGIEVAHKLREIGCIATVIFLTTSNEYVFEAFDSNRFYYIVKDEMTPKKFKEIFLKATTAVDMKKTNYIVISVGGSNIKVLLDKIKYFDVQNRLVTVHTVNENIEYYSTLEELEKLLKGRGFIRIHRSYLVNCYYIQKFSRTQITLSDGMVLPVSTKYSDNVKSAFSDYLIHIS